METDAAGDSNGRDTSQAITGILRFGFETVGAKRIEARYDSLNQRSIRVAERAGMKREGVLRHEAVGVDGTLRSTVVFAFTDEDWRELPADRRPEPARDGIPS